MSSAKLLQYLGTKEISVYNPSGDISDLILKIVKMLENQVISPEQELLDILDAIDQEEKKKFP